MKERPQRGLRPPEEELTAYSTAEDEQPKKRKAPMKSSAGERRER